MDEVSNRLGWRWLSAQQEASSSTSDLLRAIAQGSGSALEYLKISSRVYRASRTGGLCWQKGDSMDSALNPKPDSAQV